MNDPSLLQCILLAIAFVSGVMIGLQAAINKAVWGFYPIAFFGSVVGYAATVLL